MRMETVTDWFALVALAFVLGLKHGLDADHLATIDGLTRFNARERPGMARWCGVLFSLGHGAVVIGIAITVGTLARQWEIHAPTSPAHAGTSHCRASVPTVMAIPITTAP